MRETTLQTLRSVKKEEEEVLQALEQSFPVQSVMKTMVRQVVPLQSMEVHSGADIHPTACGRDSTLEQVEA